mgnify:CR=1 FL=1
MEKVEGYYERWRQRIDKGEESGFRLEKIKFRGKRIENGEFVYGDLIQLQPVRIVNEEGEFPIQPESVAQFIGYDIDGDELYTGDHVANVDYGYSGVSLAAKLLTFEEYLTYEAVLGKDNKPFLLPAISQFDPTICDKCIWDYKYVDEETFEKAIRDFPRVKAKYERERKLWENKAIQKTFAQIKAEHPDAELKITKKDGKEITTVTYTE